MKINNFEIGTGRTFIIAELCSNVIYHLDGLPLIIKWCKESGADAAKVQLFRADHFPENERESKRRIEFPRKRFKEFVDLCHVYGLAAGASVFDIDAVVLLASANADFIKMATREYKNDKLWEYLREFDVPLIWSFDSTKIRPSSITIFNNTIPMLCVPQYPAESFIVPYTMNGFGWSSHTSHYKDILLAVHAGACVVEKHVKFDKNDPEAGWSLYPDEFEEMVKDIRWVEGTR